MAAIASITILQNGSMAAMAAMVVIASITILQNGNMTAWQHGSIAAGSYGCYGSYGSYGSLRAMLGMSAQQHCLQLKTYLWSDMN